MRTWALMCVVSLVLPLCGQRLSGALITFEAAGELTLVEDNTQEYGLDPLDPSIVEGAPFTVTFSYDPDTAVDTHPSPERGEYFVDTTVAVQIGAIEFESTIGVEFDVSDRLSGDVFRLDARGDGQPAPLPSFDFLTMGLHAGNTLPLDSDALPQEIDLDDFPLGRFLSIYGVPVDANEHFLIFAYDIMGDITSLSVVPEPSTVALLMMGAVILSRDLARKGCESTEEEYN